MTRLTFHFLCCFYVIGSLSCQDQAAPKTSDSSMREITLVFTNDFESAFDPIPAFWREDVEYLGGAAQLATMVDSIRAAEDLVFLFDAGDMFTGTLSPASSDGGQNRGLSSAIPFARP